MEGRKSRTYGVRIVEDGDDFVVTIRDLPWVITSGYTLGEALANAADAIIVIVERAKEEGRSPPVSSPVRDGEYGVTVYL